LENSWQKQQNKLYPLTNKTFPYEGTTQTITIADGNPALSATNYSFTFANGSLTVDRASLQITASSPGDFRFFGNCIVISETELCPSQKFQTAAEVSFKQ
jgi:hypothetical protein